MATTLDPRQLGAEQASQWRLMWWSFRRHTMAMVGLAVVLFLYLVAVFAEPLAPFDPDAANARNVYHPPQMIRLVDTQADGSWSLQPHVLAYKQERDRFTLETTYQLDPTRTIPLGFFVKGTPYSMWGLIPMERRLFGPINLGDRFYLLGADRLGRCLLYTSRCV